MFEPVRLGIAVLASPLEVGAGEAPALLERLHGSLQASGLGPLAIYPAPNPVVDATIAVGAGRYFYEQRIDAICVVAASWYEDYLVLDMLEECNEIGRASCSVTV